MSSREIKFRAWDDKEGWLFGYNPGSEHMGFHLNGEIVAMHELGAMVSHNVHRLNEIHFSQYTGLKDNNSVEIYEGDIVELGDEFGEERPYEVSYEHNGFWLRGWENEYGFPMGHDLEVIGNIYENPDLLGYTK